MQREERAEIKTIMPLRSKEPGGKLKKKKKQVREKRALSNNTVN